MVVDFNARDEGISPGLHHFSRANATLSPPDDPAAVQRIQRRSPYQAASSATAARRSVWRRV